MNKEEMKTLLPGQNLFMRLQFYQYKGTPPKITWVPVTVVSNSTQSVKVRLPNGTIKLCHDYMLYKTKEENETKTQ